MDKQDGFKKKTKKKGHGRAFSYVISPTEKQNLKKYVLFAKSAFFLHCTKSSGGRFWHRLTSHQSQQEYSCQKTEILFVSPLCLHGFFLAVLTSYAILWYWLQRLEITMFSFFWNINVFLTKISQIETQQSLHHVELLECVFPLFPKRCQEYAHFFQWGRPSFTGEMKARWRSDSVQIKLWGSASWAASWYCCSHDQKGREGSGEMGEEALLNVTCGEKGKNKVLMAEMENMLLQKVERRLSMDVISKKLLCGQCRLATWVIQVDSASKGWMWEDRPRGPISHEVL